MDGHTLLKMQRIVTRFRASAISCASSLGTISLSFTLALFLLWVLSMHQFVNWFAVQKQEE